MCNEKKGLHAYRTLGSDKYYRAAHSHSPAEPPFGTGTGGSVWYVHQTFAIWA